MSAHREPEDVRNVREHILSAYQGLGEIAREDFDDEFAEAGVIRALAAIRNAEVAFDIVVRGMQKAEG